jgi:hypothetical protein
MAAGGCPVPTNPLTPDFLAKVTHMKGRVANAHGLTTDLALVKSYVYDKYHQDGAYYVDLAWWIETLDDDIWLTGGATMKLPSKRG